MQDLIVRFIVAVELIASSLAAIAKNPSPHTVASGAAAQVDVQKSDTGGKAPTTAAKKPEQAAGGKPAGTPAQAASGAKAATTPPTTAASNEAAYEPLKTAVITLANSGAEGKAAAINILTKYGVKKASEAPAEKWPAMQADMEAALAQLQGDGELG